MTSIIKVDNIQNSSGTDAISIDSSGRMKVGGNKIAWSATLSANQTGYNGQTQTEMVIYDNEVYNYGSGYSTSTGLFTAPVKGQYMIFAGYYSSGIAAKQLWYNLNGSRKVSLMIGDNTFQYISGSGLVELDTNDTIGIYAYTDNSSTTIVSNQYHTFFRGALIMAY